MIAYLTQLYKDYAILQNMDFSPCKRILPS